MGRAGSRQPRCHTEAGFAGNLSAVKLPAGYYHRFLELHIEQGPPLEAARIPLGIVTAIAAAASWRIFLEGSGGHAGAVLMRDRHDAFCAAAEIGLAVERAALSTGAEDTVGTVGLCEVFPGAVNSVPMRVRLELDVRDVDGERRDGVLARIRQTSADIAARRGVRVRIEEINADVPARCNPDVPDALARAATQPAIPQPGLP